MVVGAGQRASNSRRWGASPVTTAIHTASRSVRPAPMIPEQRRLLKFHAPEMVFGLGSMSEAGHAALRLGAQRPFLVTDPGIIEAGWAEELIGHLLDIGLAPIVWHDV